MDLSKRMYIGGELVAGQGRIEVVNPATERPVGTVGAAGMDDAERALRSAKAAFPSWARTPIAERQE